MFRHTCWDGGVGLRSYRGGTKYTAILIHRNGNWDVYEFGNVEDAEEFEYRHSDGMIKESYGSVDGEYYTVIYREIQ